MISTLSVAILLTVTIKVKDLEKFLGKGVQEWQQWTDSANNTFSLSPAIYLIDKSKIH